MTDSEILTYLRLSDTIDLATIERQVMMRKKEQTLKKHNYKIWQGTDGKWYTYVPLRGRKKRRLIVKRTQAELEDALVQFYDGNSTQTVHELFYEWVDGKLDYEEICKGTYDRYCEDYERFFHGSKLQNQQIGTVTEDQIEDFVRDRISKMQLKRKAYANLRTVIIGIFKYAKKKKYTDISISSFFADLDLSKKMFRQERKQCKKEVFTNEEVQIVISYLREHADMYNLGVMLDFYTGLRAGELVALKYSDFDGESLHVQRQQTKCKDENGVSCYQIVDYTKTECGDRYVFLPRQAISLIREIHMMNPSEDYLFPGALKTNFTSRLRRACKYCGLEQRSLHKVRKTYGTMLIDSGVEDSLIMEQMGHKDIQTTRSYYYFARKNNLAKKRAIENAVNFG